MPNIILALTFDDGPHGAALAGNNTRKVLDALTPPIPGRPIKAAFFVQTHVSNRLPSTNGRAMAVRAHSDGHLLAIHTGSLNDHVCHKRRLVAPADLPNTTNGLDSDMTRAKPAIHDITGADPEFVRATYGITNSACMTVYGSRALRHVHWDIDSRDNRGAAEISQSLQADTAKLVQQGKRRLVYLFHDINTVTGNNIVSFIATIRQAVLDEGHTPDFCQTTGELRAALLAKEGPGTDENCPANLP